MAALTGPEHNGGSRVVLARFVASGFGVGRVPLIAGTVGSLVAVLIGAGLMYVSPYALPIAAVLAIPGGIWAVWASQATNDPGWVVIDEFAGQWITMLALQVETPAALFLSFVLFRLIDIAKPWPIILADRSKTALGVVGDDVMAGIAAAGCLWAIQAFWPWVLR